MMGDPWNGEWHVYTGGWLAPVVYRDQGHIFNQMYTRRTMTNRSGRPWSLFLN